MIKNIIHVRANAKVNLALHVIGQRSDGLHCLDSIVAFPNHGDELLFQKANELSLSISGPFGKQLLQETTKVSNIIISAAKLLKDSKNGASIHLIKNLPIASGIGGGSSNAAKTIQALSKLWNKQIPNLDEIIGLGADVPVCLSNNLQRMQGIGQICSELSAPPQMWVVLANPGIIIPTAKIFNLLSFKKNAQLEPIPNLTDKGNFFEYLGRQRNDLEAVTCSLFPEVKYLLQIIKSTRGCRLCRMSGSGATCFGLYTEKEHAQRAKKIIKECFSKAWVMSASLF